MKSPGFQFVLRFVNNRVDISLRTFQFFLELGQIPFSFPQFLKTLFSSQIRFSEVSKFSYSVFNTPNQAGDLLQLEVYFDNSLLFTMVYIQKASRLIEAKDRCRFVGIIEHGDLSMHSLDFFWDK